MKLDYRQRLLATTLLVGASVVATPAFAQDAPPPQPVCPPGVPEGTDGCVPPDTSAVPSIPETTTPVEGQTAITQSATGEQVETGGDIVVTGSRIPQPNLESASPVTVVTSQEVKVSGTSRTEDLVNSLPQAFAAQGSNVSNGATGTATVNLRGLGTSRTMVLINGRRMQPGDPRQPVADINFIPTQLIRRVDVLTGGASSVYGADAVAGVVNFIMDNTFTGFRIDGQASAFNHYNDVDGRVVRAMTEIADLFGQEFHFPRGWSTNGGAQDIAGVFGASFDDGRGHVQAYATYRNQDPVLQSTRDYSFCALGSFAPQYVPDYGEFYCGGSSTSPQGRFIVVNPVTGGNYTLGPNQTFVPGFPLFNYAPYNFFQRPDERYTLGTFANYEISPGFNPYLEAMFMNDRSDAQIAPSGNFANTSTLNCDNPLLSAQQLSIICPEGGTFLDANGIERSTVVILRRNVEGGGRNSDQEHTSWRVVAGMRGDITRGISYDTYYQYGKTKLEQIYENDFSVTRLQRALDVVTDPATGQPVCRTFLTGEDPNCVPWNIFQEGGVTPEALTYLQVPGFQVGYVSQTIAHGDVTIAGDEYGWRMPWAENGIGANIGVSYAKNQLQTRVDEAFRTGDLAGQGGPTVPVEGEFDVREIFGEIQIPIVENNFIDLFQIGAGYRFSNYHVADNSFNTDTYKISAELAPIEDVRFRGSYNRAVRAPNVIELFTPQSLGLAGATDPCAGPNPAATLEECARTGVTAAQYGNISPNPANQYNALFGGNPELSPEEADTYTAGVVIQPRFIPGLALTADYFDIRIQNLISSGFGFQTTLNACLQANQLCDLIQRDALGTLWLTGSFIRLNNVNIGGLETRGVDFQGSYGRRLGGWGTLNVSFVGTWLHDLLVDTGLALGDGLDGQYDCASWYGATCGTPNPKWRHKLRIGLTMPSGLGVSGQWRYFSKVENDTLSNDPDLQIGDGPSSNPGDRELKAMSFFDLAFTARLAQRLNLRVGANNIFDTDPPLASGNTVGPPSGNGNTFPQVYDSLGRYIFAGFTIDF